MVRIALTFAVVTSLLAACGSKEGGASGGKVGPTKLTKYPLVIDLPGAVEVEDSIAGEGHMLTGAGIGAMSIDALKEPRTLDAAKSDSEMYTPRNLKAETLPDGFALSFENTGSMGTNYFVEVVRTIEGKAYACSTTQGDGKRAAAVLSACKTLKKAG